MNNTNIVKDYRNILVGGDLAHAVEVLQAYHANGEKVFTVFNGCTLYSDTVTMDSAYLAVTGETKAEFDERVAKERERHLAEQAAYEAEIPNLTTRWIDEGRRILDEKYWAKWEKCVPVRLNDGYRGMELGACLDIVKPLNEGCDIKEAAEIIHSQNHSNLSFGLVISMVKSFCDRGAEFAQWMAGEKTI